MLAVFRKDRMVCFRVRVQPGSSRLGIIGLHGNALKVLLTAPPIDNRANQQLVEFLARLLRVPKSAVRVMGGKRSKDKILSVEGVEENEVLSLQQVSFL